MEKRITIVANDDQSIILANVTLECSIKSNNQGTLVVPGNMMAEIILNDLVENGFMKSVIIRGKQMYSTTENEVIIW